MPFTVNCFRTHLFFTAKKPQKPCAFSLRRHYSDQVNGSRSNLLSAVKLPVYFIPRNTLSLQDIFYILSHYIAFVKSRFQSNFCSSFAVTSKVCISSVMVLRYTVSVTVSPAVLLFNISITESRFRTGLPSISVIMS